MTDNEIVSKLKDYFPSLIFVKHPQSTYKEKEDIYYAREKDIYFQISYLKFEEYSFAIYLELKGTTLFDNVFQTLDEAIQKLISELEELNKKLIIFYFK